MRFPLLAAALIAASAPLPAHDPSTARYLGNEGVLVTRGGTKILLDAFYSESFRGDYTLVPDAIGAAMVKGEAPFDGVDAIFISHIHPDHFSSVKTIAYLRAHPNVRLYAGIDVVGAIGASDIPIDDPIRKQMTVVHAERGRPPAKFQIAGIEVEAFPIPHNGVGPIPHYAFRVTLDGQTTVMHLGDADAAEAHFSPYQADFDARRTHAAFVPEWFLSSESGKRVLEQRIRPERVIGIHVQKAGDRKRPAAGEPDLFLTPGETRQIAPPKP